MNGHPRRATDVILRLSKSTTEDLSFYTGFLKELMVKMVVYDETMTFVRLFVKNRICFEFVVLIWGSFGDFSGIENQSFGIEKSMFNTFLDFIS